MKLSLQIILAAIAANVIAIPVNNPQHPPNHHQNNHHLNLPPFHNLAQPLAPPPLPTLDQLCAAHRAAARAHGDSAAAYAEASDAARHHASQSANAEERLKLLNFARSLDRRRIIAENHRARHTEQPLDWNIGRTRCSQISANQDRRRAMSALRSLDQIYGANAATLRQLHQAAARAYGDSATAHGWASDAALSAAQGANPADHDALQRLAQALHERRIDYETHQTWHTEAAQELRLGWDIAKIRRSQNIALQDQLRATNAFHVLEDGCRQQNLGIDVNWQHITASLGGHSHIPSQ